MKIFALSLFAMVVVADDYDAPRGRVNQRGCVFPTDVPPNLNIRPHGKGRIMRFVCSPGSLLVGKRFSTCLRGRWSSPPPICISKGCTPQTAPPNGRVTESFDGAMLTFGCNPGYVQNGSSTIYCALFQWNDTTPTCTVPTLNPKVSCDFEGVDLCGWSQDVTHDFEWKRNKFSTPSGHVGTGPSFDHTLGNGLDGHYMYLEASAPQKLGDVTRLFSPVYPPVLSGSCFSFWYHMYGASVGSLRVYLKEENQVFAELAPEWNKDRESDNAWLKGQIEVPQLTVNFQVIIEGVRGDDYMGDIAFDDVSLTPGSCPDQGNDSVTVQGNTTGATATTTTDEGGGTGEQTNQSVNQMTTAVYPGGITTNLPLKTMTQETNMGPTSPITSETLSGATSTSSNTTEKPVSPTSSSKVAFTIVKPETTTTAPTQTPQTDCAIDTPTQTVDENWVISLSNCSTVQEVNASKTAEASRSPEPTRTTTPVYKYTTTPVYRYPTTGDYSYTTVPFYRNLTLPVYSYTTTPAYRQPTTPSAAVTTAPSTPQSTTAVSPTTKSRFIFPKFTKESQMTTTSLPSTATQTTTYFPSNFNATTKRFPFVPRNPTTSPTISKTTDTTPLTTPITQTTASPTTSVRIFTSTATTSPPPTTTKETTPQSSTSTRKPFIYIVPKITTASKQLPVERTTETEQVKEHSSVPPRASEMPTQSLITTRESTARPTTKPSTTPEATTDIRKLFPDEFSTEEEETDHSGENNNAIVDTQLDPMSVAVAEASGRWDEFPRRPHPRSKLTSGAGVSALATACSLGALALVVSVFAIIYLVRRRKLQHQRFASTSEMRYITQSEELELGLPDNSDMIKLL